MKNTLRGRWCTGRPAPYYFSKWKKDGTWNAILSYLVQRERIRNNRLPKPSAIAIDSQSIKKGSFISFDTGIDAGPPVRQ
jgi:putative transposase